MVRLCVSSSPERWTRHNGGEFHWHAYCILMYPVIFAFLNCFGWNRSLKPLTSLSRKRHNQHDKSFVWAEHALYTSAF